MRVVVPMAMLFTLIIALAVAFAAFAGAATPTARTSSVTIKNFSFKPGTLRVKAGAKVRITNSDNTTHTFTADQGAFDAGKIARGKQSSVTLKKPGTYTYHCEIHDYMKGTITAT